MNKNEMSYFANDGKRYADYFPYYFANSHQTGTGPNECSECFYHGKIGGIFMGYCERCAGYIYNWNRGPGMNKFSNTDIYKQINDNLKFFTRNISIITLTKKEQEWKRCRSFFWLFGVFILIIIVLLWWMNKL